MSSKATTESAIAELVRAICESNGQCDRVSIPPENVSMAIDAGLDVEITTAYGEVYGAVQASGLRYYDRWRPSDE